MTSHVAVGAIARLQVQRSPLKHGPLGHRWYDPGPITAVCELMLEPGGVLGGSPDRGYILDVHHRAHPADKNRGYHDISVLFTSHYQAMGACFGDRAVPGVAGENILVEVPRRLSFQDVADGLIIETADGRAAELEVVKAAEPCVEFTQYLMQRSPEDPSDPEFLGGLQFLRHGMRGFYCRYASERLIIRVGDRVRLRERT